MTDHNTDSHTTNDCTFFRSVYFPAAMILIVTGELHGPEVLSQIGSGLFLLPFALTILALAFMIIAGILALAFKIIVLAINRPVVGAIMAFVGVNITMIVMHDCAVSLFFLPFSCAMALEILILLFSIGYLCRTSYYQQKAVVREAVVVHRFTTENNNNNNNSASSLHYYWVGEYEAPSSLQYVTPNNGDEKRTPLIQLFRNNGNQQQGAVEKNGLEGCSCTEEEEEEVCYKIQQQRFHKKFLVTVDLYQAASLEVLVLPGRPNNAMLTKTLEENRRISKYVSIFFIIAAGVFSFPGVVIPLKMFFGYPNVTDPCICSEWQTYVPYITLVVMVMLASVSWNEYYKGEFAALIFHNSAGGEQEFVTVVGPQNKKEEDEYHHHVNDDDETACTRELDNDDDTTYIREPVGTGRNGAFLV